MILLDTHPLIWLISNQSKLSQNAYNAIKKSAGKIFISAISGYKIGLDHSKKLLELPCQPAEWFSEAIRLHGLTELLIDSKTSVLATQLPQLHHDAIDRLLIASALQHHLPIVTPNKQIIHYPGVTTIW